MKNVLRLTFFVSVLFASQLASAGQQCYEEWVPDPNAKGNNNPDQYPGSYVERCFDDGQDDEVDEVEIVGIRDSDTYNLEDVLLPEPYDDTDDRREAYYNELDNIRPEGPPLEKPAYCDTIALDEALCGQTALADFNKSTKMCPYYAAAAVAAGAAGSAAWAFYTRDRSAVAQLKDYLPSSALGAALASPFGQYIWESCNDGHDKTYNTELAACKVKTEQKKLECAKFQ